MVDDNHILSRDINHFLSERLYYKYIMLENNLSTHAEVRILGILEYYKTFSTNQEQYSFKFTSHQKAASINDRFKGGNCDQNS